MHKHVSVTSSAALVAASSKEQLLQVLAGKGLLPPGNPYRFITVAMTIYAVWESHIPQEFTASDMTCFRHVMLHHLARFAAGQAGHEVFSSIGPSGLNHQIEGLKKTLAEVKKQLQASPNDKALSEKYITLHKDLGDKLRTFQHFSDLNKKLHQYGFFTLWQGVQAAFLHEPFSTVPYCQDMSLAARATLINFLVQKLWDNRCDFEDHLRGIAKSLSASESYSRLVMKEKSPELTRFRQLERSQQAQIKKMTDALQELNSFFWQGEFHKVIFRSHHPQIPLNLLRLLLDKFHSLEECFDTACKNFNEIITISPVIFKPFLEAGMLDLAVKQMMHDRNTTLLLKFKFRLLFTDPIQNLFNMAEQFNKTPFRKPAPVPQTLPPKEETAGPPAPDEKQTEPTDTFVQHPVESFLLEHIKIVGAHPLLGKIPDTLSGPESEASAILQVATRLAGFTLPDIGKADCWTVADFVCWQSFGNQLLEMDHLLKATAHTPLAEESHYQKLADAVRHALQAVTRQFWVIGFYLSHGTIPCPEDLTEGSRRQLLDQLRYRVLSAKNIIVRTEISEEVDPRSSWRHLFENLGIDGYFNPLERYNISFHQSFYGMDSRLFAMKIVLNQDLDDKTLGRFSTGYFIRQGVRYTVHEIKHGKGSGSQNNVRLFIGKSGNPAHKLVLLTLIPALHDTLEYRKILGHLLETLKTEGDIESYAV